MIEKVVVEGLLSDVASKVRNAATEELGNIWEEFLTVNVRQNIASFSEEKLREIKSYVDIEWVKRGL